MSIDITSLAITVTSHGIKEAAQNLEALSKAATSVENKSAAVKSALGGLSSSQAAQTAGIEKLIQKMQKQSDLMGANTSQINSYNLAAKKATELERQMGAMLGAEVDAYKRLSAAQAEALKMNNELNRAKAAGAKLNAEGARTEEYKKLAHIQSEALRMNREYDSQLRNSNALEAARRQQRLNDAMRDGHGAARGLSGSLGALWLTYGNFAGMAIGLAIGTSLKGVVAIGADVEHTLEGIRVRGNETVEAVDRIRQSVYDLGKGVYGPQEVAKAFETLILAGLNAEQALASVGAALNLAVVGGTSIEKAASTLVSVGSSVGMAAEGFSRIGDVISKTAALSMSSVETLSEAFKSASSVSKLYGVSLEDIATSLGVLSNLGIQGSAAGTAVKNMYKELASEADKVQNTFKKMGIGALTLKDASGNFRPLITVIKELDAALSRLTPAEEKLAIARLSNERGMRLMVQALGEYRTKTSEGSNALEDFRNKAADSFGFAAKGAIMMAQTAKSQMESMVNTVKTVFAETFTAVEPQIVLFTQQMKAAFNSKEFKDGILTIASAFATVALAIANNIEVVTKILVLMLALKTAIAFAGMVNILATSFVALGTALTALRAGALSVTLVFPALAAVLAIAAAGWAAYEFAKDEAIAEDASAAANAYSKNIIDGLIKEAEQLTKTTDLIKKKMSAVDAAKKVEKDELAQKMFANDQSAIATARAETENARRSNNASRYAEGLKTVARLELQAATNKKLYAAADEAVTRAAKAKQEAIEAQAKLKQPNRPVADMELGGDPDKSAINDAYQGRLNTFMAEIRRIKKEGQAFENQINSEFKAGQISRLEVIERTTNKEVELFEKAQALRDKAIAAAKAKGSQADVARFEGEKEQAEDDIAAKRKKAETDTQAFVNQLVREGTKYRIAELEKQHQYGQAAQMRWGEENNVMFEEAKKAAEKYGDVFPALKDAVDRMGAAQKVAVREGFDREAVREFNILVDQTRNTMKEVTSNSGSGLIDMFNAASAASDNYNSKLGELREKMSLIKDPAKLAEAQNELTSLANNQRKMWVSVGETIGDSLSAAFGKGGKAMGDLIKVAVNYDNLEKKTSGARMRAYGDAAGAAKNFFKEGTTGYKVMEGAEKAFRIAELAGMAKSLAATISTAAAKAAAWIPSVFMSFMGSMGPWGMAAAGVAIAAVMGGAFGGGGNAPTSAADRQAGAGKGSVLGDADAKSDSIANSLEIMERNSGLGLVHSGSMVKSLQIIASSIGNLTNLVLRTAGLKDGAVKGVTEGHVSSGAAKVFGSQMSPGIEKLINKMFGTRTNILDQGITLGKDTMAGIDSSGVKGQSYADIETKKKFFGFTTSAKYNTQTEALSDEINNQFTMVIKGLGDTIVSAADFLGLGGVAFTDKLNSFVVDIGEISLKGLTGEEIQEQFEAIFSKLGDDMAKFSLAGLDKFQKVGEGYFETLARVANNLEQVKDVFSVLGQDLNKTGIAAIEVSEALINSVGSLEVLTSGTKYFVDNFLSETERMAPITKSVTKRLEELKLGEITSIELYKKKVMALDLNNEADQKLYANLLELAPAFKEAADYADKLATGEVELTKAQKKAKDIADKQRELEIRLLEVSGNSVEATNLRRADELAALNKLSPALADLQSKIYAAEDAATSLANAQKFFNKQTADAKGVLERAYQKESKGLEEVIDKFKEFSKTLKKFKEDLLTGDLSNLSPEQKYEQSRAKFMSVSALAATGDKQALEELQDVSQKFLTLSREYNASTEAYTKDFDLVQKALTEGASAADTQVSIASTQLAMMKSQYESLVGIEEGVLSFKEAFAAYVNSMNTAKEAGNLGSMSIQGAYKTFLGREAEQGGLDFWTEQAKKGTDAIAGIANSVEAQINNMYRNSLGRNAEKGGMDFWMEAAKNGNSLDAISKAIAQSPEAIKYAQTGKVDGSHYEGLNSVPKDNYLANLHQGERVQTAQSATAADKNSEAMVELTKELIAKVSRLEENSGAAIQQQAAIAADQAEQAAAAKAALDKAARNAAKSSAN